jgi:hypothetical protein
MFELLHSLDLVAMFAAVAVLVRRPVPLRDQDRRCA